MCELYTELQRLYQRAVDTFSMAVYALEAGRPSISRPEYERLVRYVDQAYARVEQARVELDRHTAEHNCLARAAATQNASGGPRTW